MGSKELVAWLPTLLGLGADDVVGIPAVAYPTYDVGARLAGATSGGRRPRCLRPGPTTAIRPAAGLNCPSNPTGAVLAAAHLRQGRRLGPRRRRRGGVDECYAELGWSDDPGAEHPRPRGVRRQPRGAARRLLAVQAVQPRRVSGRVRRGGRGAGAPAARGAQARGDDRPVAGPACDGRRPRRRRPRRRTEAAVCGPTGLLRETLERAGFRIDASEAGLYLWCDQGEDAGRAWPGSPTAGCSWRRATFYGAAGAQHVRVALTATDERVAAAASRW